MARMFSTGEGVEMETVNPWNGCTWECYNGTCWAARMAKRLQGQGKRGYGNGFAPTDTLYRMNQETFRDGETWAVGLMGDISAQRPATVNRVIEIMRDNPETDFLLCSKAPVTYYRHRGKWPKNAVLGATIETNRAKQYRRNGVSRAPDPRRRAVDLHQLDHPRKHVAVEPVLDFDLEPLTQWITDIEPETVAVGYATGPTKNNLNMPEPPLTKTRKLIEQLDEHGIAIDVKEIREPVEEDYR